MRRFTEFSALALLLVSSKVFCQEPSAPTRTGEFRVASDLAIQSYNLESDGFKASDGGSSGTGVAADLLWKRTGYTLHVQYKNLSHEVNTPTGLTPAKVSTRWQRGLLNYETDTNNQVIYQFGLDYRSREATETTPNVFMPKRSQTGLRFGAAYSHLWDNSFRFECGAGLMIPFLISETTASTGSFRFGANPDLNFDFIYKVNPFIDLSLGLHWIMEFTSFAGPGNRGTVDATETFHSFFFPIELRFQF